MGEEVGIMFWVVHASVLMNICASMQRHSPTGLPSTSSLCIMSVQPFKINETDFTEMFRKIFRFCCDFYGAVKCSMQISLMRSFAAVLVITRVTARCWLKDG